MSNVFMLVLEMMFLILWQIWKPSKYLLTSFDECIQQQKFTPFSILELH